MRIVKFYNTLTRKKEVFKPLRRGRIGLYTCGPTVYNYAHIGNLRTYVFEDVLRRTLEYVGYKVRHVMNITDVGHLTSDADLGEDKLEKGARREKRSVGDIAKFYTAAFLKDITGLNVKRADKLVPATAAIREQIKIIQQLFKKGFAYQTTQAVYFDVSRFKNYTKLSKQKLSQKISGARKEVVLDPEKRNPYDFALWFKTVGRFQNHVRRWPSPWGTGFPGWHIECSAISTKYLGQPFDIHTGGVDHINVHHTNEIAQSRAAYGKALARFWMHGEFLLVDKSRMGKSEGNFLTLESIIQKGFHPLSYRYLVLTAHYRSKLNFTWGSLAAAAVAYGKLVNTIRTLRESKQKKKKAGRETLAIAEAHRRFLQAIHDDLNTPIAISTVWFVLNSPNLSDDAKLKLILDFDQVLGLGLDDIKAEKIPAEILKLADERERERKNKNWEHADRLRQKIEQAGYALKDTPEGPKIEKSAG